MNDHLIGINDKQEKYPFKYINYKLYYTVGKDNKVGWLTITYLQK